MVQADRGIRVVVGKHAGLVQAGKRLVGGIFHVTGGAHRQRNADALDVGAQLPQQALG